MAREKDSRTTGRNQIRTYMLPRGRRNIGNIEKAKNPHNTLLRLFFYFNRYRISVIFVCTLIVLYSILGLLAPYLMGVAIDLYISLKTTKGLVNIASLMLIVYVLNNIFQAIANRVTSNISQKALKQMRKDLFQHLQSLPLSFFDQTPAGDLMSRLTNDIDAISQAISLNITSLLASMLSMAGILIAMFILDTKLALASLFVVPLMFGFSEFVARYTRKGYQLLQKDLGTLNSVMEESISGAKVIKAFRKEGAVTETFLLHNQRVYTAGIYANTYALLLMPLTGVLGNFFAIILVSLGSWLALKGLATVGLIATFINYGQNFIQPLRQVSNLYNTFQAALAGAERVFEIIDMEPEGEDNVCTVPGQPLRGHVCFDHVSFEYKPGIPIIKNLSFETKAGETVALVGPTGAGKTTITNLITRFYEIKEGRITIDKVDIRTIPKSCLRQQLGLVLQETFLFSDSVMENIRFGRLDATDEEVITAAKMAEADHFIGLLPQEYHTLLSERGSNLSQGQRQLLSIARAILANPRILILDEATSNVDTRTEIRIQNALLHLMEGRTSFVIAHRLSTIRNADQVLVINKGELVEKGTHEELLQRQGFYYHLYISQFKGHLI